MNILVIDAQGGGIGKQIVSALKKRYPEQYITCPQWEPTVWPHRPC